MRDNLFRAGDSYDDLELCADLVGFFNAPVARTGLIVWGGAVGSDGVGSHAVVCEALGMDDTRVRGAG